MRVLFVADLHYALKQFDWLVANAAHYDPIIIGGDLLDLSSHLDFDVQIVVIEKYLHRIRQQTRLLVSSGNHDGDQRSEADESVAQWILDAKAEGMFVDGESVAVDDVLFTVCPWWDGPVSRAELEAQLDREAQRPKKHWVWVHHAPPAGSPVCWTGKTFAGDEFLLEWIKKYSPDLVLSGHIHNSPFHADGAWVDQIGNTWVFNPGKQPGPCPTYIDIDLETMDAEWISLEGRSVRRLALADG